MKETFRIAVVAFFAVLLPVTLWNTGFLYLAQSCDPKFGCLGVFKLRTLIVVICASITAISMSLAHYIFARRSQLKTTGREIRMTLFFAFLISIASGSAIRFVETVGGVPVAVSIWFLLSFLIGVGIFKTFRKPI